MIQKLLNLWKDLPLKKRVVVITGESFSQHSKAFHTEALLKISQLHNEIENIWPWTFSKREELKSFQPLSSYQSLVKLEEIFSDNFILITNAIDGLHLKAGNYRVLELRGNINKNRVAAQSMYQPDNCPKNKFGQFLQPDLLFHKDHIDERKILQSHILCQQANLIIIIGNNLSNSPFLEIPAIAKKFNNAKIIEISEEKNFCGLADVYINSTADDFLSLVLKLMVEIEAGLRKKV